MTNNKTNVTTAAGQLDEASAYVALSKIGLVDRPLSEILEEVAS